ncbi:M20 family metallopeptidase [Mycoplasmatota bacterium WC44]
MNIVNHRRELHKIPELEFDLPKTRKYLLNIIKQYKCDVLEDVESGIVVTIKGTEPGKTVAIRADMDSNKVIEDNEIEYKSTHHGQMHSCGHDGHMAMALGVLDYYATHDFKGTVKVIFQPAEENCGGAYPMIQHGIIDDVDYIFAYHIWPDVDEFKFGVTAGPIMSAADAFRVKIVGKGGHSAMPEKAINPVDVINEICNRFRPLQEKDCKLVVTQIHVGDVSNVIAANGDMAFTLRTKDMKLREEILENIEYTVETTCKEMNATCIYNHERAYPVTINDEGVVERLRNILDIQEMQYPSMASEDFSYFLQKIPGAFIWLGAKRNENYSLHHPKFNFNEDILTYGANHMIKIIQEFLK